LALKTDGVRYNVGPIYHT